MIEVKNLQKSFDEVCVLKDICFKAKQGEIITLLGPNGAGKTTLMRCLCGYLPTNGGEILVDGKPLTAELTQTLQKFGYMPENTPLYSEMKVFEYLKFVGEVYKMSPDNFKKRLKDVVEKLQLNDVLTKKISALSKGFRRRVGVGAAILNTPKILILDEPTEGLDPNQKTLLRNFLKEYAKKALVIISTHLLEETEALASRVIILNNGRIIKDTNFTNLKKEAPKGNISRFFYQLTHTED
ncbi:MAG: ABC transporter ATP-binding protein [Alphaproteobacteria bacterium]|nr:ABC transporter ATP-binding protein [Alphaproteobacteria bacterium]